VTRDDELRGPEERATDQPRRPGITVSNVDHLVLTVADVPRTIRFYARALGMQPVTFGDRRRALLFGRSKINLHEAGHELSPHAAAPVPGSADLCFVTEAGIGDLVDHLTACGIEIEEGPVHRTGALGPMLSCYVRDPDGNLVEISTYPPDRRAAGW
jgi:catechol 2,3-dioxygenase-like lactoylglutathione lyase family enzyme